MKYLSFLQKQNLALINFSVYFCFFQKDFDNFAANYLLEIIPMKLKCQNSFRALKF